MTTQTPADIKLLPLPRSLFDASVDLAASYNGVKSVERAALRDRLYDEVKDYALACIEADRKERAGSLAEYCLGRCDCRTKGADPAQCKLSEKR